MVSARLQFRRHLAACALLLLAGELLRLCAGGDRHYGQTTGRAMKLAAALPAAEETNDGNENQQQQTDIYRYTETSNNWLDMGAKLLALVQDYLPQINLNYSLIGKGQFENEFLDRQVDAYYEGKFPRNMSVDALHLMTVKATLRMAPMPLHTSWGYVNRELARKGSLPVLDDALCTLQLSHLAQRLDDALQMGDGSAMAATGAPLESDGNGSIADWTSGTPVENFESQQVYGSRDLQLMRYLDSFGRVPSDLLYGNIRWYGAYSTCLRTRLGPMGSSQFEVSQTNERRAQPTGERAIKFRYCMGALRSTGWPREAQIQQLAWQAQTGGANRDTKSGDEQEQKRRYGVDVADEKLNNYFLRVGLCLPEACDSTSLERQVNARSIDRLAKFALAKPFNGNHYKFTDLYCVPDERSPLRRVSLMGRVLICLALLWLALVSLATLIHLNVDKFYVRQAEQIRLSRRLRRGRRRGELSASSTTTMSSGGGGSSNTLEGGANNEFHERDLCGLRAAWIQLNVALMDGSRKCLNGIDIIECLSLYSNWLKYTKRVKLAVVSSYAEEQVVARNLQLAKQHQATFKGTTMAANEEEPKATVEPLTEALAAATAAAAAETTMGNGQERRRRVDTSSLNALKVIALVWIIAGHCIFYLGSTLANGAHLTHYLREFGLYLLADGAIYITELFFLVTGCLTCYSMFKHNTKVAKISGAITAQVNGGAAELSELNGGDNVLGQHLEPSRSGTENKLASNKEHPTKTKNLNANTKTTTAESQTNKSANTENCTQEEDTCCLLEGRLFEAPFWCVAVLARYLRIVPTYLLVYAFVKLLSVQLGGEGQLWDYAVSPNSVRRNCAQESWWPVLTLTTNWLDIYQHCIVGGWYLSVDMQFALMSVPLLILLARCQRRPLPRHRDHQATTTGTSVANQQLTDGAERDTKNTLSSPPRAPLNGNQWKRQQRESEQRYQATIGGTGGRLKLAACYGLIVTLGALSALVSIVYALLQRQVDLSYIFKFSPHTVAMLSRNIAMYTNSIFRFRSFAAGLLLGHLVYLYEFKLIKLPKLIQLHGSKLTVVLFSLGSALMFLPVLYPKGKLLVSHDITAILIVATACGIDLFLCAIIFLICIGKAPKLALFVLNSPFWSLLSSLSLSAFLIHSEVIVVLTSQLDPNPSVSYAILLFVFSATLLVTYALALGLYLSFEMPVSRLIESMMRKYLLSSRQLSANKRSHRERDNHNYNHRHHHLQGHLTAGHFGPLLKEKQKENEGRQNLEQQQQQN